MTNAVLLEDKLSPAVKLIVVNKMKDWQFVPVRVNDVAVPAMTYVDLAACAIPSGDGYDLAVSYVSNGPQLWEAMPLEFSPVISRYSNKHQSLKIKLRAMADGQARLEEIVMLDVAPAIQPELRGTITQWVKSMLFKPEQITGQAVATELEWPLELVREPLGTRHPNVDVANDPTCKSARSGSAGPRSIDSPLKRKDALPDAAAPSG